MCPTKHRREFEIESGDGHRERIEEVAGSGRPGGTGFKGAHSGSNMSARRGLVNAQSLRGCLSTLRRRLKCALWE